MKKTRFAPSPTGHLHIGGARTAIISWLIAKKLDGKMALRIEDTDVERSKEEYTRSIMDSLSWLGINHDEDPIYQMQRLDRYQSLAHQLVKDGKAYYCYCTNEELQQQRIDYKEKNGHDGWKYDRKWRDLPAPKDSTIKPVIRLKIPLDGEVKWDDLTKGTIKITNSQLDDFIIMRSDGIPTYNFCVVVDDVDMKMTHVIRGDDHINNTPKQIHIYNAIDAEVPIFGHIPLILNINGKKQSKRDEDTSVNSYKEKGFLPEAIVNYLLLISCNDVGKEIFTKDEFVNLFELNKLGNTPIKFDEEKLLWINQQHIKKLSTKDFVTILKNELEKHGVDLSLWRSADFSILETAIKERSKTINDFYPVIESLLKWDKEGFNSPLMSKVLNSILKVEDWNPITIHDAIAFVAEDENLKFGEVVKPLRKVVFLDGKLPLAEMILFLGKEELIKLQKKNNINKP